MEEGSLLALRLFIVFSIIALNAFFSAAEFALVSTKKPSLEAKAARGSRSAIIALHFYNNPDRFIAASQVGITIASLALGWVGEETVAQILKPFSRYLFGWAGDLVSHTAGAVLAFGTITYLHVLLGEQVPKSLTLRWGEKVFLSSSIPMQWFYAIFKPFIWLLDRSAAIILKPIGIEVGAALRAVHTLEELKALIKGSYREGILEEAEEELLTKVFDFGERTAREVMIPRTEIVAIEADLTLADFLEEFKRSRHARYPIYEDSIDNIIGFVAIKDVLLNVSQDPASFQKKVRELARPAYVVPESKPIDELMKEMRTNRIHMAVVIDEYGGTAGLVTLEELLEEIVGRVTDESALEKPLIEKVSDNVYYLDAALRVDEVNETLGLTLPESEDYETLAGLIFTQLQRVPREGDELHCQEVKLTVTEMKGPRIVRVKLERK
ncbi:MAG: hemolysin family protein [Anaerolineae bacterium]|nr:hemolysin family protein [Anaerolineae bacterium]MDW8102614.1 hemolysin family protein [Anaerolineae bacterium]